MRTAGRLRLWLTGLKLSGKQYLSGSFHQKNCKEKDVRDLWIVGRMPPLRKDSRVRGTTGSNESNKNCIMYVYVDLLNTGIKV